MTTSTDVAFKVRCFQPLDAQVDRGTWLAARLASSATVEMSTHVRGTSQNVQARTQLNRS